MKSRVTIILLCCTALNGYCQAEVKVPSPASITGYYTRLPFRDSGFSGKYADIVIALPQKGQFVFSREYSYQPYWEPAGGKRHHIDRLIERKGEGPNERPDKHNICSNASIGGKTETAVTVHWRYAPDLTKESFTDFLSAYNKAGNPSAFYADYAGISLKMNGRKKTRGGDYKAGIEMGTDGSYALVIWMEYSSTKTVAFEIVKD